MFTFDEKYVSLTPLKYKRIFTKIVSETLRTNLLNIVLSAIFLTIFVPEISAQVVPPVADSTAVKPTDTLAIKTDSIKPKKGGLDAIIKRTAEGYEKIDQRKKELTLYDQGVLTQKDMELKSGIIIMNYEKNEVFAGRLKDSSGVYSQYPYFKQGANVIEADSIHFNTVSKKARVWNSRSDQGEFRVKGEITKKENDSVYFIKSAHFTTSKNIDDPEYYFFTDKIKFVPGKKVVVGLTNLVIADVPTPVALPFAFFPMTDKAESGFLIPTFGENNNQGYFLQNGGYYLALSDYYDLAVTGDYYTNGSYGLRFESNYAQRYKFNGNIHVRFENLVTSERGLPDYAKLRNYNIQWSHNQDAKANPNSRFTASVNLGSSQYFRQSINMSNVGAGLNNNFQSSISYSKTLQTVPQVNFSLAATHSQNTNTEQINMSLPTLQASVDRIFLFAKEDEPKKGFFKNINLQYNLRGENRVQTNDSLFFKAGMWRDMRTGFQHSIPLNTNFKVFKFFSVTAGTNYQETWVFNTIERTNNPETSGFIERDVRGFDSYRTYDFRSNVGTTIYGNFNFGDTKKIQAIRHVIKPAVGYSYSPSFDQYYDSYTDNTGRFITYSRFTNGLFGAPRNTYASSINMSVANTFEAKVRDDANEDAKEPKKVMLLNNLTFTTSYDMAADSLAWQPLQISAGTNLLKDKMNINFGTRLNPYALDNNGRVMNMWNIDNGGSLFRMESANITINYSLTSKDGDSGKKDGADSQTARNGGREDDLFGTATDINDQRNSMFKEEDEQTEDKGFQGFYNAKLPWDLRFAYSLTYSNSRREKQITGNSIMISGNIDITPKWKMGFSSGYDFVQQGVTFTQLRFERDLLSWRMDFNWVPFGDNTFWGFFIGIKSSVLQDIKWEKRRVPDRTIR